MKNPAVYPVRDFPKLRGLPGLADPLVGAHLKLYAGYVTHLNLLRRQIEGHKPGSAEWAELNRRVGWEINGLRLHECYFEQLVPGGAGPGPTVARAIEAGWGGADAWRTEFTALGTMRGIGWVILYRDPVTGALSNHRIESHDVGHPAGFTPVLVLDVWEHAYTGLERPAYIEAFLANVDWSVAERRVALP